MEIEIDDFMIARREAEKEITDAVDNAIENFRQKTSYSPHSISISLCGTIGAGWAARVKVSTVTFNA